MSRWTVASIGAIIALNALGQPPRQPQPQRYGPWTRDLYIQESDDGLKFDKPRVFVERAGVPSLCRDAKGRLLAVLQWFPFERRDAFDKVAVAISEDDGKTWGKPQPIEVGKLPDGYERPYDPTIVLLDDGRLRLYFTSRNIRARGQQAIYSAISGDGVKYEFEPGVRFSVEDGERRAYDCAVAKLGTTWHLYTPNPTRQGRGYHAKSTDGLDFMRVDDVTMAGDRQWLGNVVASGKVLRFYGSGRQGMWMATSHDGSKWEMEETDNMRGGDPGIVLTGGNRWLRVYTGQTRSDADTVQPPFRPTPVGSPNPPPP